MGWLAALVGLIVSTSIAFLVPQLGPHVLDTAENAAGYPTLGVTVEDDESNATGQTWSTAEPAGRPPIGNDGTWVGTYPPDWFHHHNAVRVGASAHRVILENLRAGTVELLDIRPVVVERRPPLSGSLYFSPHQGEVKDVSLRVNLDASTPTVHELNNEASYFASRHVQLSKGERIVFRIRAEATRCYCRWRLVFEYHDGAGTRTVAAPLNEQPALETTGYASSYRAVYNGLQRGYPSVNPVDFCRAPHSPCQRRVGAG